MKLSLATSIACCSTLNAQKLDKYEDLKWEAKNIPAEKNGLPVLNKVFEKVGEEVRVDLMLDLLRSITHKKQRAYAYGALKHIYVDVDTAIELPFIYDTSQIDYDTFENQVLYLLQVQSILQLRTFVAIDQGDMKSAKESLAKEFMLVSKLSRDSDQFLSCLVCDTIETELLRSVEYLLHSGLLDTKSEKDLLQTLPLIKNKREAYERVLKHEFLWKIKFLDLLERDGVEKCLSLLEVGLLKKRLSFWQKGTDLTNPRVKTYWMLELVKENYKQHYNRDKTIALFAQQIRIQIKESKLPLNELMKLPKVRLGELPPYCPRLSNNWLGQYLANPHYKQIFMWQYVRSFVSQQSASMLGTLNGLRKYKNKHGKLPKNLQELVPEYIESVPKDIFSPTGAKIQYDQKRGMIWSVGTDGKTGEPKEQIREKGWLSLGIGPDEEIQMFVEVY